MKIGDLVLCKKTPTPDTSWPTTYGIIKYIGSDHEGHYIKVYYPNDIMVTAWHRKEDIEIVSEA
tara:strand:+ start:882 stop:1073 length:192 start_codon:yes stop_codon:yes gene_type:complete